MRNNYFCLRIFSYLKTNKKGFIIYPSFFSFERLPVSVCFSVFFFYICVGSRYVYTSQYPHHPGDSISARTIFAKPISLEYNRYCKMSRGKTSASSVVWLHRRNWGQRGEHVITGRGRGLIVPAIVALVWRVAYGSLDDGCSIFLYPCYKTCLLF